MEKVLQEEDIKLLRSTGVISSDEIAISVGDLVVAENVCTRERRVVDASRVLAESKRRILKG